MKPQFKFNKYRKLKLPNHISYHEESIIKGKDYGKKINLTKLARLLEKDTLFKIKYDLEINPIQNFITIQILNWEGEKGWLWIFGNGSVNINIGLKDQLVIDLVDYIYQNYGGESLEN